MTSEKAVVIGLAVGGLIIVGYVLMNDKKNPPIRNVYGPLTNATVAATLPLYRTIRVQTP
jgi:hypothetical protein